MELNDVGKDTVGATWVCMSARTTVACSMCGIASSLVLLDGTHAVRLATSTSLPSGWRACARRVAARSGADLLGARASATSSICCVTGRRATSGRCSPVADRPAATPRCPAKSLPMPALGEGVSATACPRGHDRHVMFLPVLGPRCTPSAWWLHSAFMVVRPAPRQPGSMNDSRSGDGRAAAEDLAPGTASPGGVSSWAARRVKQAGYRRPRRSRLLATPEDGRQLAERQGRAGAAHVGAARGRDHHEAIGREHPDGGLGGVQGDVVRSCRYDGSLLPRGRRRRDLGLKGIREIPARVVLGCVTSQV